MKVIVAVDSKLFGKIISDFVANYRWPTGTKFRVVNVVDPSLIKKPTSRSEAERGAEEITGLIAKRIERFVPESQVKAQILHGICEEQILQLQKDWNADMIVLGSHSKSEISKMLAGSVSTHVVLHAPCSVAVLRLPEGLAGAALEDRGFSGESFAQSA